MIRIKEEVTPIRPRVTKVLKDAVTKLGRPSVHKSAAAKQAAYRARKKAHG